MQDTLAKLSRHGKHACRTATGLIERFGLAHVRVWLVESSGPIATATTSLLPGYFGGLTLQAVRQALLAEQPIRAVVSAQDPRFSVAIPGLGFAGIPLRAAGATYGLIEAYAREEITLSAATDMEREVADFASMLQAAAETRALESASNGRILVADADAATRAVVRRILTAVGFEILEAEDGETTIEVARREGPDLILMDWSMPDVAGSTTAAHLRADARARTIPIVMLTSKTEVEYRVEALEGGAQDFITKPCEPAQLVRRVEQILRWRRLLSTPKVVVAEHERKVKRIPANLSLAMYESRHGNLQEALTLFVTEAEACDSSHRYADAARAYRAASVAALHLLKYDLSNKFIRLTGKMYLCLAETTNEVSVIGNAYVQAAKCFLEAGNMPLVTKAIAFAASFESLSDEAASSTPRQV